MHQYTLGFIFSADLQTVYLIRKNRPEWQAGLLNGVSGKRQGEELYERTMAREAEEESGYRGEWTLYACMGDADVDGPPTWVCPVYYSVMDEDVAPPVTCEEEAIEPVAIRDLLTMAPQMISNLPWLILAALNHITHPDEKFTLDVSY